MKHLFVAIFCLITFSEIYAQCPVPASASVAATPAYCLGGGIVTVSGITGGGAGNTYQYELRYDSVSNTSVAKPYQDDSVFTSVLRGRYKVNVRTVCPGVGISAPFTSASVTVSGTTAALAITGSTVLNPPICGNGSFSITATGGNTNSPYQYALVPSLGAAEPVATYIRPKQSSNTFQNLSAGTYYARVYDSCGSFSTLSVVLDSVVETVSMAFNRNSSAFYACDSMNFRMNITVNYKKASGTASPLEKFWVTYNGVTDTIGGTIVFAYSAVSGTAVADIGKMLKPISYPAVVTYGFKSVCGNIYSKTDTVKPPNMQMVISSNSISCTQKVYTINVKDSLSALYNYYNTYLSVDSGNTWSPRNAGSMFRDTFIVGNTYHLVLASGCDTERVTITTTAAVFNFLLNPFTAYSCNNMSGFYIGINGGSFSGPIDSVHFQVLAKPAGSSLPDSFYFIQQSGTSGASGGFRLSYNLTPGTYTIKGTDKCGATTTKTITINQTVLSYTISPKLSCTPSQSGFRVTVAETNYNPYAGYSAIRVKVTNTATSQVDSFTSGLRITAPGLVDVTGLTNGTYLVSVYRVVPAYLNPPVCTIDTTYINTANQPLSIGQSYFTASCANGSATVSALAQGGGGSYSYSLYKKDGSGIYQPNAGPQASGLFNGLLPGGEYQVRVTDTCGNGTQYATSFNVSAPSVFLSGTTSPCPGDPATMSVPAYPGASYTWLKNSSIIPAATGNVYQIGSVPAAGTVDTYKTIVSLGSCIIYTNAFVLDPVNCGMPLPVSLVSFGGSMAESGGAQLYWEIGNPESVAYFVVEYSEDSRSFVQADIVSAGERAAYSCQDRSRSAGKLFYRLKMIGKGGDQGYSHVLALQKSTAVSDIAVFPTLVNETAHIRCNTGSSEALQWSITDLQGKALRSGSFTLRPGISELLLHGLNMLPAGVYLLRLDNRSDIHCTRKIIVSH